MRGKLLIPVVLLAALAFPIAISAPAFGKGATDVVVSGPGVGAVTLSYTRRPNDIDVGSLAEVSGIYLIYGAAIASDDPGLAKAELGPRYRLTWHQGSAVMAVSDVFPFARNGAWTHVPHEQAGWVRGDPDLERAMVELGAERPQVLAATGVSTGSTAAGSGTRAAAEPAERSASTGTSPRDLAGLAALALLLGAGTWFVRRRRTTG